MKLGWIRTGRGTDGQPDAKPGERVGETGKEIGETGAPARGRAARRSRCRSKRRGALVAHRAFAPLIGLWGAALCGLAIAVLPPSSTAGLAAASGIGSLEAAAHFLFAALAALAGGALAFGIAQALSRRARARRPGNVITSLARMRPIDPVSDLGSDSLDAPLERMPLGMADDEQAAGGVDKRVEEPRETREAGAPESNPAQGDGAEGHSTSIRRRLARARGAAEADRKAHDPAGAAEEDPPRAQGPDERADDRKTNTDWTGTDWTGTDWTDTDWTDTERPAGAGDGVREMDLAEFGALPGRNGVWIDNPHTDGIAPEDIGREEIGLENAEEEGPATAPAPCDDPTRAEQGTGSQAGARAGSPEGSGAIARLRERPADELSLVEMVERLAAALHDRQAADQALALAGSADRSGGNEADSGGAVGRDAALTEALKALGDLADGAAPPGRDAPAGPGNRELAAALARLHDTRGAA